MKALFLIFCILLASTLSIPTSMARELREYHHYNPPFLTPWPVVPVWCCRRPYGSPCCPPPPPSPPPPPVRRPPPPPLRHPPPPVPVSPTPPVSASP
ncbi:hypothetical protein PTKIN_Ptkin14bG0102700 [Pterospermum kingtungense]